MRISKLTQQQIAKIAKTALYLAISSVLGGLLALIANDPNVFGVATPIINVVLVTAKQFFTEQ